MLINLDNSSNEDTVEKKGTEKKKDDGIKKEVPKREMISPKRNRPAQKQQADDNDGGIMSNIMKSIQSGKGEGLSRSSKILDLVGFESDFMEAFNDMRHEPVYAFKGFGISGIKCKQETKDGTQKTVTKADVYRYDNEEIIICPEPIEYIKDFDDVSDDSEAAKARFSERVKTFQKITLDRMPQLKGSGDEPGRQMWLNKTSDGINLRPGMIDGGASDFDPIRMCDDNVHGLIAGRTGSGKSVFINALILSLITEYAPWELDLYLADFKKVELSRYMNNSDDTNHGMAFTPHVNACAATSEIRYVISLLKYLVDCMNARQEFFARVGVTKIKEFREQFGVVLPRVLLIVDEFQQMFMEATQKETEEIQVMLNSITKLGRATGFHLVFASQEMSGTLRGNTLANFKIRMCLPCEKQISVDILGNAAAGDHLERGYVLINTDSGDVHDNKKYRVPFINAEGTFENNEKSPFYHFLDVIKDAGYAYHDDLKYKYDKQKFYQEDQQEREDAYIKDLDKIRDRKNDSTRKASDIFDAVVLGKSVKYSSKFNDKVSFTIKKGRNKAMMVACPDTDNVARIRKLLAENLFRSDRTIFNFGIELNNIVFERFKIDDKIKKYSIHPYYKIEDANEGIDLLKLTFLMRQQADLIMRTRVDEKSDFTRLEKELLSMYGNPAIAEEYNNYIKRRAELKAAIADCEKQNKQLLRDAEVNLKTPIIRFFDKCSSAEGLSPLPDMKPDISKLPVYQSVSRLYDRDLDILGNEQKAIKLIEEDIKADSAIKDERAAQILLIKKKIFIATIKYFSARYKGDKPEERSFNVALDRVYDEMKSAVDRFKTECEKKESVLADIESVKERMKEHSDELERLEAEPNEMEYIKDRLEGMLNTFFGEIYGNAMILMGEKRGKFEIPKVLFEIKDNTIAWKIEEEGLDPKFVLISDDIIDNYVRSCRGEGNDNNRFTRAIFWINGFDEIEKIPNQLADIIRNALNMNILIIAMITSELKDATIRKAFDYAFVTGNIEKFYNMFDIKYTKQPLDSFVVNFGIRSKGMDMPFKMYKSDLGDIADDNFVDELLNSI
jgi:hypothetical protein